MATTMDQLGGLEPSLKGATPNEQGEMAELLAQDREVLKKAEAIVQELPPGHVWYRCPDSTCTFGGSGPPGSNAEKALRSHIDRHSHARLALERKRT